jgi:hypothetical protein
MRYSTGMEIFNALKNMKWWGWVILIFLLITAVGQCGTSADVPNPKPSSQPTQKEIEVTPTPLPQYSTELLNYKIINPASIDVYYNVTNTNGMTGIAECTIRVSDASGTYKGFDVVSIPVIANELSKNVTTIIVTNEGATYITEGSVTCQGS